MAIYKRDIASINLETGTIHRTFLNHSIGYKDQKADHFGIRVFRDGEPVDLTGVSVQGVFMPPQGDPIAITSGNIVSGNEAEVVLPQACYNYDGQFCLAIKLVDSNNSVTGTMRIVDGMVDNTHASGTVAPTSAVPTYQEILSTYDAMVAATAAANGAIAATYSSSSTYKVGDYCIHDGGLYRCTTAITTAEAWTSGHWTAAKIGPDVSDLKSALTFIDSSSAVSIKDKITTTGGLRQDGTNGDSSSFSTYKRTDYIPVMKGWVFSYSGFYGNTTVAIIVVYDTGKTKKSYVAGNGPNDAASGTLTISEDGFIRVSSLAANLTSTECTLVGNLSQAVQKNAEKSEDIVNYDRLMVQKNEIVEIVGELNTAGGVNSSGGDYDSSSLLSNYKRTGYIWAYKGTVIDYTNLRANLTIYVVTVYDTSKTKISAVEGAGSGTDVSGTITMSADGYVRFCSSNASLENVSIIVKQHNSETSKDNELEEYTKLFVDKKRYAEIIAEVKTAGGLKMDGDDYNSASLISGYKRTGYIWAYSGTKFSYYGLKANLNIAIAVVYDRSKTKVSAVEGQGSGTGVDGTFTMAADGYVRFCSTNESLSTASIVAENISSDFTYVAFGDSLTAGRVSEDFNMRTDRAYPALFAKLYRCNVYNDAIGGQALVGSPFDKPTAYETITDSDTHIAAADLITLKWGNNDPSTPIGDTETEDTILYEINRIINYIRTKNDHALIKVLSPNNQILGTTESRYWYDYNASGWSLSEYNDAIGAYCRSRNIEYIDVNGWSSIETLSDCLGDDVHPKDDAFDIYSFHVLQCVCKPDSNVPDIAEVRKLWKPIDVGQLTDGTYINRSDGAAGTGSTVARATDYIPVHGGFAVAFRDVFQRGSSCVAQYDSSKTFISAFYPSESYVSEFMSVLADNAAYVRITARKSPYPVPSMWYTNYATDYVENLM